MNYRNHYKVVPIGFDNPSEELPDLLGKITTDVSKLLVDEGINLYDYTIDVRPVINSDGYSAVQVRAVPRKDYGRKVVPYL